MYRIEASGTMVRRTVGYAIGSHRGCIANNSSRNASVSRKRNTMSMKTTGISAIAIIRDGEAVCGRQMSDVALLLALGQGRQDVFEGRCCRRVLEMGDSPIDVGSGGVELAGHSGLLEG